VSQVCVCDGCEKPVHARNKCGAHYAREYRKTGPIKYIDHTQPCSVEGCVEALHTKNFCSTHYHQDYCRRNKEVIRAKRKKRYEDNREEVLEQRRQYRQAHPEYMREYAAANRERFRAKESRRRGRKKFGLTFMTDLERQDSIEWRKIIKDRPCAYCGGREDVMTDDHLVPVSKGGTDHWFNIVRACMACNSSKCARDLKEWTKRRQGEEV
jgi:5-methylcytosine-specific restriction endonuclease McrA